MTNYTTHRNNKIDNKLNHQFGFIFIIVFGVLFDLSVPKSMFDNLFVIDPFQIQFYNFQGKDIQNKQEDKNIDSFLVQLEKHCGIHFDKNLPLKKFKIFI